MSDKEIKYIISWWWGWWITTCGIYGD